MPLTENIINSVVTALQNKVPGELIVFLVSLLPVLELRGGLIAAKLLGLRLVPSFVICYIGNMLPIPFILLFIRKIFNYLKTKRFWKNIVDKLETRSMKKGDTVQKYKGWGLLLFVAIPFPGTGGWTGALIAALIDMRISRATCIIAVGVLIAGLIMALLSYGIPALVA